MRKFRFFLLFGTLWPVLSASAEWLPLWPGTAPGGAKPAVTREIEGEGGRLTDIAIPQYEVFLPEPAKRTGMAVVVFPGGGYTWLSMEREGRACARWLNQRGIVAVLAKYRVSGRDEAGFHYPVPLLDARRAIRVTRARAAEWGVRPQRIGVMGFSAGGHLAAMCATLWNERFAQETNDPTDRLDCRPDFAVLVYPVITMAESWTHNGSKRRLLGADMPPELAVQLSTERRVSAATPPCFLVHAADDSGVPVRNSLEFAARCAENKVPVVCHVFATGGHGFGIEGRGESENWTALLDRWLAQRKQAPTP